MSYDASIPQLACGTAFAQRKVDAGNMYECMLCVVPVVGKGTMDDPRRPLFASLPARKGPPTRDGILAFEFVERDRAAFRGLAGANRPDVRVFQKGRNSRAEIESEFRRYRMMAFLDADCASFLNSGGGTVGSYVGDLFAHDLRAVGEFDASKAAFTGSLVTCRRVSQL